MFFRPKRIYFDWASAAPMDPAGARGTARATLAYSGNPSAPHAEGRAAFQAMSAARERIARSLAVKPDELTFTGGGTEGNNLAIRGLVKALGKRDIAPAKLHIVSSTFEHSSVMETLADLERAGVRVARVPPRGNGIVEVEDILAAVRPETALVTLAHVQSELGTVMPIAKLGDALAKRSEAPAVFLAEKAPEAKFPVLHADAAQSLLSLDASPHALRAGLVSYDAQKLGGPKGIGVLYRDSSVPLAPFMGGGSQERGIRPGTENVPGIVGAALAFELAKEGREAGVGRLEAVRDRLIEGVLAVSSGARLLGDRKRRIAGNACFAIPGADGDYLAVLMDREGVAVTPRSACIGSGGGRSEVVFALTGDDALARSTIRFSLGPRATAEEADRAVVALRKSLATLQTF
ncbi:MAG: cysteine desulfurase family protein [Patescibacteria group bacterium]